MAAGLLGVAVGCGALRPAPLELPPGHRAVLGRVDLTGLRVAEATLMIVREDGTFWHALSMGQGPREFAIALPPGQYRVARISAFREQQGYSTRLAWNLELIFEVGEDPGVYIGTLELAADLTLNLRVSVTDEYDDTLRALRRWYRDLPEEVARSLMTPG